MENLLVPFSEPARLVFNKLVADTLPTGSQTLTVVLNKEAIEGKIPSCNWLEPHLKNEIMQDDLKKGKFLWIYPESAEIKRMLLVPVLSDNEKMKDSAIRKAAKCAIKELKTRKVKNSIFVFGSFSTEEVGKYLNTSLIENAEHIKRQSNEKALTSLDEFLIYLKEDMHNKEEELKYWVALAKAVILSQNLVNQSPTLATPGWIEEQANMLFKGMERIKISSIVGEDLAAKNYGCLYAVGKGAVSAARLVTIQYKGRENTDEMDLALVGKGVTFDTGGLNLKTKGFMESMHLDKSGACDVIAAVHCINELKLPINIVGCLTLAENTIGKAVYKPSDILTSYLGKTVEVTNTDAEGRLCLIDGMGHVQKWFKPKYMLDIATLTGGCVVALGKHIGGLFSNNDDLANSLLKCSSTIDEAFWRLPVWPEHIESMRGLVADLKNFGSSYGGTCSAAGFLQEFVLPETKWAHFDIAGPATEESGVSLVNFGTGFGTQTLVAFAKSLV